MIQGDTPSDAIRPITQHIELEEGQDATVACKPCMPSAQEVELHNTTHIPFRSWCPYCVAGKAKANAHRSQDEDKVCSDNVVSIDYAFVGDKRESRPEDPEVSDADDEGEVEAETGKNLTVLVLRDRRTRYVSSSVVPRKGDHHHTVHRVGTDLANILGYKRVHLKSDQERAIRKLKATIRREYDLEIPEELSSVGDSQSNGEIEITVQIVEGQIRILKCQLENHLNEVLPVEHPVLPWLVRHAGATISRYQRGKEGLTAYRRLKGRDFTRVTCEFGECIWYLKHKDKRRVVSSSSFSSSHFFAKVLETRSW